MLSVNAMLTFCDRNILPLQ